MGRITVSQARLNAGVWEAVLVSDNSAAPQVEVLHEGTPLPGVSVVPEGEAQGLWLVRAPIPARAISDGVHSFVVQLAGGALLDRFTLIAGTAAESDLRAELDLLRAEFDLLKAAFRQHCAATEPPLPAP